jgi:hypothetical protein
MQENGRGFLRLDGSVTVTVKQNFALPGLQIAPQRLTLQPGQYTVLVQ